MARRPRPILPRRRRRREVVHWHPDKIDMVSIAGVLCKRVGHDKDGYVFRSITEPTLYFAFTHKEYNDQLIAQVVRPAEKD